MKRILSLGAGIQSSALCMMVINNKLNADFGIMSNTGSEKPETYQYLNKYLLPKLENKLKIIILNPVNWDKTVKWWEAKGFNIPYSLTNNSDFHEEYYGEPYHKRIALHQWFYDDKSLPFRINRNCTDNWKTKPIYRYLKNHNILEGKMLMGFSYDEIHRIKDNKKKGFVNEYPLIDLKISRNDLINTFYKDKELPEKSGCFMCPFSRKQEWKKLKGQKKPLFDFTVDLEERAFIDLPLQNPPQTFYPIYGTKKLKDYFPNQSLFDFIDGYEDLEEDPFCGESCMT